MARAAAREGGSVEGIWGRARGKVAAKQQEGKVRRARGETFRSGHHKARRWGKAGVATVHRTHPTNGINATSESYKKGALLLRLRLGVAVTRR